MNRNEDEYGCYVEKIIGGYIVMVDECDTHILDRYCKVNVDKRTGYKRVISSIRIGNGKRKVVAISREILGITDPNIKVDHCDGNTLNNRRYNIRPCTNQQNIFNSKMPSTNNSGYKGVHWYGKYNKWVAKITINNKKIHLGYFGDINDAIDARKNAEIKYHGEYRMSSQNL